MNDITERRRTQTELYGAPLSESIARLTQTFRLSQAAVARALGVSAPMLSQLVSAQRIKIGNPIAVQRLRSLLELADEVDGGLEHRELEQRLAEIEKDDSTALTRARAVPATTDDTAGNLHRLLRAVASGRDLRQAAERLTPDHPEIAAVLRIYGTGSPEERERHYQSVRDLM